MNELIQQYITSFGIGLAIAVCIVALTPKEKLLTFEELEEETDADSQKQKQKEEQQQHTQQQQQQQQQQQTKEGEKLSEEEESVISLELKETAQQEPEQALNNNTDMADDEDNVSQYVDNPQMPVRRRRNNKKEEIVSPPVISVEVAQVLGKKPKLKKFFGVTDETIAQSVSMNSNSDPKIIEAIDSTSLMPDVKKLSPAARATVNDAKEEIKKLLDNQEDMNGIEYGLFSIVIYMITLFGILGALLLINIATNGDFGRMITAMFPRETKALKLKEFLDNFHNFRQ